MGRTAVIPAGVDAGLNEWFLPRLEGGDAVTGTVTAVTTPGPQV
jgi:hypothetical protein